MKHALGDLREVSRKRHEQIDRRFELQSELDRVEAEIERLTKLRELAIDEVNRKAPAD